MERLISNIGKLVAIDTSNPYQFDVAIQELKALFNYSKSSVVLCQDREAKALLFGVNCELHDIKNAVVFSRHIDTVNTNASRTIEIMNNSIYGLGTADMKSFFACVDYCLRKDQKNKEITPPIIVSISFDEEKDNKGISAIIDFFKKHRIVPSQCIVGEPTNVCVATKCRGCFDFILSVYSSNAHITDINADNPVEICAQSSMLLKTKQSGDVFISAPVKQK